MFGPDQGLEWSHKAPHNTKSDSRVPLTRFQTLISVREISVLLAFGYCNKASRVSFSIYPIMKKCDIFTAIGQFLEAGRVVKNNEADIL